MNHAPHNRVVVAGAGTGKTHALVVRYLDALFGLDEDDAAPRSPERILAITFTDKAANEMRARVQRRLASLLFALRGGDESALDEVERALLARARERGRPVTPALLEAMRRALATAPILTFHAFCARTLREHAIAGGLDPGFTVLEADDERRLLLETAEAAVLDALRHPLVAELCARVALRGFGEKKGLVECLVAVHQALAERGLRADDLALASDPAHVERAVVGCLDAVDRALLAIKATTPVAMERLVRAKEALGATRAGWLARADAHDDDPEARLAHVFPDLRNATAGQWGGRALDDARRALVGAVTSLGAALVDAYTSELAPVVRALLVEVSARAAREKDARGALGFGDLLLRTRALLLAERAVRARVKGRFDRALVDEYQDTSPAQEDMLALLIEDPSVHAPIPPGTRPLDVLAPHPGRAFLVGDAKQSIYGFRGADPSVLTRALARVGGREELVVNRRSTAPVVAVANLIAAHALTRGPLPTDAAAIVPLQAFRGGEGAAGAHWLIDTEGADPAVRRWGADEREAAVVAQRLRALLDEGAMAPRDACVLVRRGRAATLHARALQRAGVPAVVVGGDGFYRRPEVADALCALALALDSTDELSLLAVLRSPLVAVPDDQVLALYEALPGKKRGLTWGRALAASEAPTVDGAVRMRLVAFDAVLALVRQRLLHESLARALDAVVEEGSLAALCAVEHDAQERLANLEKLRALCAAKDESGVVALLRLLEALDDPPAEPPAAAATDDDGDDEAAVGARPAGAVSVMTIHQAKGLEFPIVVIADAGTGLRAESDDVLFDVEAGLAVTARGRPIAACAPKRAAGADGPVTALQRVRRRLRVRAEAELARLLYVAATRARERVFVVGQAGRNFSMLTLFAEVRERAPEQMDALLPQVAVTPMR
ncbi:MAG: UvrD-helicase domain-containing protein [Deltaproteobacteria bacterium]|nr:UvrD-helicase domain-containing protein [Deltaproteobacteria bacterium]